MRFGIAAGLALILRACATPTYDADREVVFVSRDGSRLAGTLSVPNRGARPLPAVLLVAGGGPTNRDDQVGPNKPFAEVARALTTAGYAVLRYDKRGVGGSSNASGSVTRARLIEDAAAAFDFLRNDAAVDARRIFTIGHSEGGELVLGLAYMRPLRGVIMLAPLPKPYLAQLRDQMARLPRDRAALADLVRRDRAFFESYRGIDPREEIRGVGAPMLLLHGAKDIHVLARDIAALDAAGVKAHRTMTYIELPNDNHFFMPLSGAGSTGAEFSQPHPFDPRAINIILEWIARQS